MPGRLSRASAIEHANTASTGAVEALPRAAGRRNVTCEMMTLLFHFAKRAAFSCRAAASPKRDGNAALRRRQSISCQPPEYFHYADMP